MIDFNYELEFTLDDEAVYASWLTKVIESENKKLGEINYIFCDDEYILSVNQQYLKHDYYTDVITFDYVEGDIISGDLFISLDTVRTNAEKYSDSFESEAKRVIIHGVLHLLGLKDKTESDAFQMRIAENKALEMFPSL